MKRILLVMMLTLALLWLVTVGTQTPETSRNWSLDQAILATAEFAGDEITIRNVRNFSYRSTSDYTPDYFDTVVKLSELERVDYIVEPFGSIGAAHTFLSFGFSDGQQVAISVEIRKQVGESFSPWQGVLRKYELAYVIASERDVIDLRANQRQHDVYLYPTTATKAGARRLFVAMLERANSLQIEPEFYNTISNNCTTNIARHIAAVSDRSIGLDYRLVLPAHSDALALEEGFIAPGLTLDEARAMYRINDQARLHKDEADFSRLIRLPLPAKENEQFVEMNQAPSSAVYSTQKTSLPKSPAASLNQSQLYEVIRVVDGDTIDVLVNGQSKRVRYIGINTPETVHPSRPAECFGKESSAYNAALVAGQMVALESDITNTDKYGRLLRYVYVGEKLINLHLVEAGYAYAYTYPPDVKYNELFLAAEKTARTEGVGLWGEACAAGQEQSATAPSSNTEANRTCPIKGNINAEGVRIYHVPGCDYYRQTIITETAGEQWFCTEAEAEAAGWRKALNCPQP